MKLWRKVKGIFHSERASPAVQDPGPRPLREFIYLDEVSLLSLLSSQKGEVTDTTSEQLASGLQTELAGKLAASAPAMGSAELASKFQTSNSSTIQTSRKATVQSWFRELHALPDLRLIEPIGAARPVDDEDEVARIADKSIAIRADDLRRGSMVEFRVRLTADYVFHLGTMAEEFAGIAEDFPAIAATPLAKAVLADTTLVSRLLQRLLAGLIPIRCEAIDHVVVMIAGVEYVARHDLVSKLDLECRRLELVGVTEHLAYWKDIRRVLFSSAECRLLARVARSGLQESWTPVKLAHLFDPVAPDLVNQITRASRDPFLGSRRQPVDFGLQRAQAALIHYQEALSDKLGVESHSEVGNQDDLVELAPLMSSATGQREAFAQIKSNVEAAATCRIDPDEDLALRNAARASAGLTELPGAEPTQQQPVLPLPLDSTRPRLLDVEVVAIYW